MHTRAIILSIVIFLLIVAGMFYFAYLSQKEQAAEAPTVTDGAADVDVTPYDNITRVDATHFYIDGVHTIVGEFTMPTPCDLLESEAVVAESYPEQVMINFKVINNAEQCVQMITPARFKVSAPASAEATFSARLNGRPIELNLIEAAPGETPDNYELFIKG